LFPDPQAGGRRIRWDKTKRRDLSISFAGHYRLREEPPSSGTIKKLDHVQGFPITERLTRLNIDSRGRARYRRIVTMAIQEVPSSDNPKLQHRGEVGNHMGTRKKWQEEDMDKGISKDWMLTREIGCRMESIRCSSPQGMPSS